MSAREVERDPVEVTHEGVTAFVSEQSDVLDPFMRNRLQQAVGVENWRDVTEGLREVYRKFHSQPPTEYERSPFKDQIEQIGQWIEILDDARLQEG